MEVGAHCSPSGTPSNLKVLHAKLAGEEGAEGTVTEDLGTRGRWRTRLFDGMLVTAMAANIMRRGDPTSTKKGEVAQMPR